VSDLERRYARAEEKNEVRKAATVRRGPVGLVAVCLGVALVVGVTAAVDLRRLQTPQGTALAWAGAAVFGDCTAYRELSEPKAGGDALCRQLREQTEDNREDAGEVALEVGEVRRQGDRAQVDVRLVLPEREEQVVVLDLRRRGGGWAVERSARTCAVLACP
jgi:hypothetical protein